MDAKVPCLAVVALIAISILTTAAYRYVNEEKVLACRADRALARGDYESAAGYLEAALKKGAAAGGLLRQLAEAYLRQGRVAEGVAVYERLRRERPGEQDIIFGLAEGYTRLGRLAEAAGLYAEILKDDPRNKEARIRLARILAWEGRFPEAVEAYRIALGEGR